MRKKLFVIVTCIVINYASKGGSFKENESQNRWLLINNNNDMDTCVQKQVETFKFGIEKLFRRYSGTGEIGELKVLEKALGSIKILDELRTRCLDTPFAKPILEYIAQQSDTFTPEYACSIILQDAHCYIDHPHLTWMIHVPSKGPMLHSDRSQDFDHESKPLKILHLTDIHISYDYHINGIADCGFPICCKRYPFSLSPFRKHAKTWGDYNCDTPPWLYEHALNYINNTHKDIDLVYFTGDIIDHTVWRSSKEENANDIINSLRKLAETFGDIPVLPVIGNHETIPLNIFPPNIIHEKFSQKWLYDLYARLWSRWLPHTAIATVAKQGYYSFVTRGKLKIIALNNNVCYTFNWWLLYDTSFLKEQLEFLKKELLDAEMKGQFVHIIAHLFPGEKECIEPWEVNYNLLITRFAHIIKGQFFGHTHTDGIKVFYSAIDGKPNNIGYNGAGLTPYLNNNPNYKIISADPNTFDVLDIDTYYFNITEANLYKDTTPRWRKLYSLKEAYGLSKVSPENIHRLAERLAKNKHFLNRYWKFYVKAGDAALKEGCNEECRYTLLSSITRTVGTPEMKKPYNFTKWDLYLN